MLRDFRDEDATAFDAYHCDPRSLEFYEREESLPGHAKQLLASFMDWARESPRRNYQLAIVYRRPPHALIGSCGLRSADAEDGRAELGIELAPEFWSRYRYAIEVLSALVEFGFRDLKLREIYGRTVSANARVARLVSSFGGVAVTQPTPASMAARGWSQVEWQITREQWESGRLTSRFSQPARPGR